MPIPRYSAARTSHTADIRMRTPSSGSGQPLALRSRDPRFIPPTPRSPPPQLQKLDKKKRASIAAEEAKVAAEEAAKEAEILEEEARLQAEEDKKGWDL